MPPVPARPKTMPVEKYVPFRPLPLRLENREWPNRQIEKAEPWILPPQLWQVVSSEVVAHQESGAGRRRVHATHNIVGGETPGRKCHHSIAVRSDSTNLEDPVAVGWVGLDVDRERRQVGKQAPRDEGRPRFKCRGHGAAVDGIDGCAGSTGFESVSGL